MKNYTSEGKIDFNHKKEENSIISKKQKGVKATVNTRYDYFITKFNKPKNRRNLCKFFIKKICYINKNNYSPTIRNRKE